MIEEVAVASVKIGNHRRPLNATQVSRLSQSIQVIGLVHPITVTKDLQLLAGLHRLEAFRRLGFETIAATIVDLDEMRNELIVLDENLIRAELSVLERSEALQRRKVIYETLHPDTKHGAIGFGRSRDPVSGSLAFVDDTAEKTGRSRTSIAEETKLAKALTPATKDILRGTDLANEKTDLMRIAKLPAAQQTKVAKRIVEGSAKNVKEARVQIAREEAVVLAEGIASSTSSYDLHCVDMKDAVKLIPAGSVDCILADLPYDKESVPLYEILSELAAHALKEGGSLLAMSGQSYLPDVLELLRTYLTYNWTICMHTDGPSGVQWARRVTSHWKPIFHFVKGPKFTGEVYGDYFVGSGNTKTEHVWQQDMGSATWLVENFSKPGDVILDPTVGSGTYGEAALRNGRRFIGLDRDQVSIDVSKVRLDQVVQEILTPPAPPPEP